jgi:hypothetical protein
MHGHTLDFLTKASRACTTSRIGPNQLGRLVTFVARALQRGARATHGTSRGLALCARQLGLVSVVAFLGLSAPALASECPNEQARQESNVNAATGQPYSMQLPDCRGYELVSPPDTGGIPAAALDEANTASPHSGAEWDHVTAGGALYWLSRATPAETGAVPSGRSLDVFVSRRTGSGWATRDLTPFSTIGDNELIAGAPDGSAALILTQTSLLPEDQDNPLNGQGGVPSTFDVYRVSEGQAPLLVSHGTLPRSVSSGFGEGLELNEVIAFNAPLTAVDFVSTARLAEEASLGFKDCYAWSDVGVHLASLTNPEEGSTESRNCELLGMTADGRPIFRDLSGDSYHGRIFVGDGVGFPIAGKVTAVQLSAPPFTATTFDALSPDGSLAYVTTAYTLGHEERGGEPDVYAVTIPPFPRNAVGVPGEEGLENTVVCLSCQVSGGGAATLVAQSADGSHVFFNVAEAAGESTGHPYKGLWSWDRNSKTAIRLTEAIDVEQLVSSQNGQYVVGLSKQLAENLNGKADVYEFSANLPEPRLIASAAASADEYRLIGNGGDEFIPPTAAGVSNDGQRVVYDNQPPGEQSLETLQEWTHGGTVQLSPLSATSSYYALGTAGAKLEDVFFAGHEALVPADRNGGTQDVYDARVQGGFPPCTTGNPIPPSGAAGCASPESTPNPQVPSPLPYAASLGLATFTLPPLPADTAHPASPAEPLTRAQKLAKALEACKRGKSKSKRSKCDKEARKRYGLIAKTRKSLRSKKGGS